jgi:DNA-binding transcriptional LysR family regulator
MSHATIRQASRYFSSTGVNGRAQLQSPTEHDARSTGGLNVNGSALEFRELRYFTVLCEELHFGRAAERLHISQSPLSQAIAQLERKLGTRLLDRSSRHVRLTPAGEVLLEHGRRLLREVDDAVGATRRAGAGETGTIRIAVAPVARVAVLPGFRHELDEVFPTLGVEIVDHTGDDVLDAVRRGAADIGLMMCASADDDIATQLLRRDGPVAVFLPTHPLAKLETVTVRELAQHTLILWPRNVAKAAHNVVLAMFHGHPPASTRTVDPSGGASWEAMHRDGFAVTASSAAVGGDFLAVPIADANAEFTLSLVWNKHTPLGMLPGVLEAAAAAVRANGWL